MLVRIDGISQVGELWFHADVDDVMYSCVSVWERIGGDTEVLQESESFRKIDDPRVVELRMIACPLAHMPSL